MLFLEAIKHQRETGGLLSRISRTLRLLATNSKTSTSSLAESGLSLVSWNLWLTISETTWMKHKKLKSWSLSSKNKSNHLIPLTRILSNGGKATLLSKMDMEWFGLMLNSMNGMIIATGGNSQDNKTASTSKLQFKLSTMLEEFQVFTHHLGIGSKWWDLKQLVQNCPTCPYGLTTTTVRKISLTGTR